MVSGRFISERPALLLRPVAYTVAPAAPSWIAICRPAPRVAPATRAIFPVSGCVMPATLSGIPDNRRPNLSPDTGKAHSIHDADADPTIGSALALHLDHL